MSQCYVCGPPRWNLTVRQKHVGLSYTHFSAYCYNITSIKTVAWNFLKTLKNAQPHRQFVRLRFRFELASNYMEQSFLRS